VLGGDGAAQLLQVRLQALHSPELAARTAAPTGRPVLLVLSDPSTAPVLPAELLALLFALSPAEAQLAAALCRGLSPSDHAAERRCPSPPLPLKCHSQGRCQPPVPAGQRLYSSCAQADSEPCRGRFAMRPLRDAEAWP
jgi:hypothetical protein